MEIADTLLSDQIGKIKAGIFCFINWNTNLRQLFDLRRKLKSLVEFYFH